MEHELEEAIDEETEETIFVYDCRCGEEVVIRKRDQPEQFVVVTTAADGNLAEIHHRSPAVLPQTAWSGWLSAPVHEALKLLSPPPAHYFNFYPVSSAVGRVSNDYPELVAPLTTSEEEAEKHGQAGQADLFR